MYAVHNSSGKVIARFETKSQAEAYVRRTAKSPVGPKTVVYRGWRIERMQNATQIGHRLPGAGSIGQRLGLGTHRQISGWHIYYPEEYGYSAGATKWADTLKEAKEYIDNYEGSSSGSSSRQSSPPTGMWRVVAHKNGERNEIGSFPHDEARAKSVAVAHARQGYRVELFMDDFLVNVYPPSKPRGRSSRSPSGRSYTTRAPFMRPGARGWSWIKWTHGHANKHAAILEKAKEIGATAWDFGQADHFPTSEYPHQSR